MRNWDNALADTAATPLYASAVENPQVSLRYVVSGIDLQGPVFGSLLAPEGLELERFGGGLPQFTQRRWLKPG